MARQLLLIEDSELPWRLDETTKAAGIQGVADARRELAAAAQRAHQRRAAALGARSAAQSVDPSGRAA